MTHERDQTTVVVTGIGLAAPTGLDLDSHWQAVLAGKSAVSRIHRFDPATYPVRLAGQVPDFEAKTMVPRRLVPQTDHWTQLGLYAADLALTDSGVVTRERPEYEMAVVTSSSSGGTEFGQHEMERLYQNGPSWVSAYQSIAWFYAATTGQVSIRHGLRGPCGVVCAEQAGGLDAIAQAVRLLRKSGVGLAITGGTDASLSPYGLTAQLSIGLLSTVDDPASGYRPFDPSACGYFPGEGGALLVVERELDAVARDAKRYGVIAGHAAGFQRPEQPSVLASVIRRALADAHLDADDVDVVFADGMANRADDQAEARAIAEVFGPRGIPVTAPKTLTGRLYGGGAPLDVVTALLSLRDNVIPHTAGTETVAPDCPIDLVLDQPRERKLSTALVLARGYGGFTSALVVSNTREGDR
ncbi:MAG TPA: ketosynthase chain-length factor [Pseudonocardiaceae bacterium]|nr:ketosynthase chain-length factor [Pseudonocardiaceae bacterium]